MPELPEVDAITGVVRKHAVGDCITRIRVLRGPNYFKERRDPGTVPSVEGLPYDTDTRQPWMTCNGPGMRLGVTSVDRMGKLIVMGTQIPDYYLITHNMMTGYFDWKHDPWTFDYVEADREPTADDVRVLIDFESGKVLRFHDSRLFGRMGFQQGLPEAAPELMRTPNGKPDLPLISLEGFAEWLLSEERPIKHALMDQSRLAGIGNIYSNEGCHLAGIDPHVPGQDLRPYQVPILLEALRCVVAHSIPQVRYDWLRVYRRSQCGSCGGPVERSEIAKRATFACRNCQGEPQHGMSTQVR